MIHLTSNELAAANNQPAETHKADRYYYPTDTRLRKEELTLIAQFAPAGHVVHCGRCDDFIVCKFGYSRYCQDSNELCAHVMSMELCHV